mgnify:CR=1 FL=1
MKFTEEHEWMEAEGDVFVVGITEHATEQLGDLVFVELPEVGDEVSQGDEIVVIESVKAASDIQSPVTGTIVLVNDELEDSPELLNEDPYENWIVKIDLEDESELNKLLNADEYEEICE